jgi:hypothetical protein
MNPDKHPAVEPMSPHSRHSFNFMAFLHALDPWRERRVASFSTLARAGCPQRFAWSVLAMAITAPVWAHHSAAGYDMTKTLSAAGHTQGIPLGGAAFSGGVRDQGPGRQDPKS